MFLSDPEIERVVEQCTVVEQDFEHELVNLKVDQEGEIDAEAIRKRDDLYESAIEVVLREGRGSCSLLQRALGIGYGRAARMIDYMAEDGIVGQHNGSSAREILMSMEDWELIKHSGGQSVAVADEESVDTAYADDEFLEEEEYLEADDDSEYEYEDEAEADADDEDDWEEEGLAEETDEEAEADEYEEYEEYEEAADGDLEDDEDVEYVYVDEEVDEDEEYEDYEDQEEEEEVLEPTLSLAKAREKAAVAANGANEEDLWDEYDDDDSWADEVDEELDS